MCLKHSQGAREEVPAFSSLFLEKPAERDMTVASVNTVLGPVDARHLGVTLMSEALKYVLPGAEYAFDIRIDRAEVFDALAAKLTDFRAAGGGAIVDATGMFEGRDLRLFEALSRETGVHIIASSGQGPENMLGGYYLTPQTNPPTPWPAQKFAEMFGREVNEGMVVPRLERRATAGLICTAVSSEGMTPTDESLVRGAARAAAAYGVSVMIRSGHDALVEMARATDETLDPSRIVMGSMDRRDAFEKGVAMAVAKAGGCVAIDHVGSTDPNFITDAERVALIEELISAGFEDRIILSSSATGVAFGVPGNDVPFGALLTTFVPMLLSAGVAEDKIDQMLVANTARLLSVGGETQ
jgi:phosphotriesterase-related protein